MSLLINAFINKKLIITVEVYRELHYSFLFLQ